MLNSKNKRKRIQIGDELTITHHKDKSHSDLKSTLQSKTVQKSLFGIAAIAACGAVGYALTRPNSRRRLSRYSDQLSGYIPGLPRKTSRLERIANDVSDAVDSVFKR